MSHNSVEIQEGAIIISDAHYSPLRPELLKLIEDIEAQKIETPQLILMGDIFDALFGDVAKTQRVNATMIEHLNAIAKKIEVIYLEGNHDFNLAKIFPDIKIFPLSAQPLQCRYKDKTLYLAHGDFDVGLFYKAYSYTIRNPYVLSFLASLDRLFGYSILKYLDIYLAKKEDCNSFENFETFIQNRELEHYLCDYFIEGHFHQNRTLQRDDFCYINLAAFACNQRYFIVKSLQDKKLLEEKRVS